MRVDTRPDAPGIHLNRNILVQNGSVQTKYNAKDIMKRLNVKTWLIALLALGALTACDMMKEDLDDCPTGLYVSFVYDYNIDRADFFKDHVGAVMLYVYDDQDRMVAQKTVGDGYFSAYGRYIHFSEKELKPGTYRLLAVAMQKNFSDALATPGAKYRQTGNAIGDLRSQLTITLDHGSSAAAVPAVAQPQPAAAPATRAAANVPSKAPLDTLWHTLTTIVTPSSQYPLQLAPASITPAKTEYTWQSDGRISSNGQNTVTVVEGEPTYATMSLIRDTKHLNITLQSVNKKAEDNVLSAEDFTVEIIDVNSRLDADNNLTATTDTIAYHPYAQWTTSFTGSDLMPGGNVAHYDLMFNRLLYKNASVVGDQYAILDPAEVANSRNAVLLIRKASDRSIVFGINLPYALSCGRTYQERIYHYQEYLDREYKYNLHFLLKEGKVEDIEFYIGAEIHPIPWTVRQQHENFE